MSWCFPYSWVPGRGMKLGSTRLRCTPRSEKAFCKCAGPLDRPHTRARYITSAISARSSRPVRAGTALPLQLLWSTILGRGRSPKPCAAALNSGCSDSIRAGRAPGAAGVRHAHRGLARQKRGTAPSQWPGASPRLPASNKNQTRRSASSIQFSSRLALATS